MNKGKSAGNNPFAFDAVKGKNYAWCSCGLSKKQPFCDNSHKGTVYRPVIFKTEKAKNIYLCICKQTNNQPFCDGSHSK